MGRRGLLGDDLPSPGVWLHGLAAIELVMRRGDQMHIHLVLVCYYYYPVSISEPLFSGFDRSMLAQLGLSIKTHGVPVEFNGGTKAGSIFRGSNLAAGAYRPEGPRTSLTAPLEGGTELQLCVLRDSFEHPFVRVDDVRPW